MKDIKDYLHLYLGQKVRYRYIDWERDSWTPWCSMNPRDLEKILDDMSLSMFEIQLRPLSDMTEEEAKDVVLLRSPIGSVKSDDSIVIVESMSDGKRIKWHFEGVPNIARFVNTDELNPRQFRFLLSKGFDLFGLIESGLAIDKTTLKQPRN